ncbi:hypothetical protein N9D02_11490 [Emcibacteraceae bacterium]|nr:hypothetical protein [Emcibacteraceae bacterium]
MEISKLIKTFVVVFFIYNTSHAETYEFELTCTSSVRFFCTVNSGCVVNKDLNPTVYKIQVENSDSIKIDKYVGGEKTSDWTVRRIGSDWLNKYHFVEDGVPSIFSITNDKRKFTHIYPSGISLYNSDLSLNQSPSEDLGGQIKTGSCIPN